MDAVGGFSLRLIRRKVALAYDVIECRRHSRVWQLVFKEGIGAMKNLVISLVASGFAFASTQAVAATVVTKVNVPAPQVKLSPPRTIVPKVGSNRNKSFEIKDFSFGVENPTTVGSASGGAGAGKINFGDFSVTDPKACRHCPRVVGPRP